jgi:predicted ATP-grasp superfamily ATP-dependent carboligase
MTPTAVVMNVFYTGLGIARSLGERGVPVIGLTAHRRIYGNFTRYAKTVFSPDSRSEPEALLEFLLSLGRRLGRRAVLFPTRDDDLVFLDRFRNELEPYFSLVLPPRRALEACLSKWETCQWARRAGVAAPKAWMVEDAAGLERALEEVAYPCVLKPLSAHHWRQGGNWEVVGARKAIAAASEAELRAEYDTVARADRRALLQEMVPGPDDALVIAACYLDRDSRWIAGFNTRKLLQIPAGFGTGCIVESVSRPELFEPSARLLQALGFTGIAEVEYKWDAAVGEYKLIEINPRPWDQHRLGAAAGVDLIYLAYCEHAGLPLPPAAAPAPGHKWIAEDSLATALIRSLRRGSPDLRTLRRLARGRRIYAIWDARDPLPALAYTAGRLIPDLIGASAQVLWSSVKKMLSEKIALKKRALVYETHINKSKTLG